MGLFISILSFSPFGRKFPWILLVILLFITQNILAIEVLTSEVRDILISKSCVPPVVSQVPSNNLQARYLFNGDMSDVSGKGNQGIPQSAPSLTSDRFSSANSAFSFDGVSQWMATTTSYNDPNTFSIGLWFKTTTIAGGGLIGFCDNQTTTGFTNRDRVIYMNNSGQLEFGVYAGSIVSIKTSESYNDGFWHFAVATLSGSGMKLYVDGILKLVNSSINYGQSMSGYWRLGYFDLSTGWSTATSNYFNGILDDAFYYDRELTGAEIQTLYSMPDGAGSDSPKCAGETLNLKGVSISGATYAWTGPAGFTSSLQNPFLSNVSSVNQGTYYLTITDGSGCSTNPIPVNVRVATVSVNLNQAPTTGLIGKYLFSGGNSWDLSGSGNTSIFLNSPALCPGRFGNSNDAILLDGTSQYISTANSFNNPSEFTIAIWFRTTTNTGGRLIGFGNNQSGPSSISDRQIYMTNSGQLIFGVNNGTPNTVSSGGEIYNDGQWHCAVGVLSSSGMSLYVDGVLRGSDPSIVIAQNYTGYWRMGYDEITAPWPSPPTSPYFNGQLDDVYIYNVAISPSNISKYNQVDGAGSNEPFCTLSGTLNLTAPTFSGAYSYNWTGPNGFVSTAQNPSISGISTSNAGIYTLTVTTTSSCPAKAYVNVRIDTPPAAPSVTANSRCGPGIITVNAVGSPLKYRWYSNSSGGVSLGGSSSFTSNIASSTTYYVSSVNAAGCESSSRTSVIAKINPLPVAPVSKDSSRCGPGTIQLKASGSTSIYTWYSASSGGILLTTGSVFTTPSISSSTTYFVTAVDALNCESIRVPVAAKVNALPVPPAGKDSAICGPGSVVLTASGSPYNYNWYVASIGGSSLGTGPAYSTPILSSTTTYYVASLSSSNCESSSRTPVVATVNNLPPNPQVTNINRCGPGSVVLKANGSTSSYNWYADSIGGSLIFTGSSFTTPVISSTATYYVSSLSSAFCESVTRVKIKAIVNDIPPSPIGIPGQRCNPGTVVLGASNSPSSYNWYSSPSSGTPDGTGSVFTTPILNSSVDYYVSSVSSANCESSGRTLVAATVNLSPSTPSPGNGERCGPGTVVINASGSPSGYNWYSTSTGGSPISTGSIFTTPSLTTTTLYYVTSVGLGNCESIQRAIVVATIHNLPPEPNVNIGEICGSGVGILSASGSPFDYHWYDNSTGGIPLGAGNEFYTPSLSTSTTFYVSSVDTNLCESSTRAIALARVNSIPAPPTASGDSICGPGQANLNATGSVGNYSWFDAYLGDNLLGSYPVFTPNVNSDTVFYVCSVINTCQSTRVPAKVIVSKLSDAGSLIGSQTVCLGQNSGSIELTGYTGKVIKWESSKDNFVSDINNLGNNSTSYLYSNLTETKSYRVIVKSGFCPSVTSSSVTITMDPSPLSVLGELKGDTLVPFGVNSGSIILKNYVGNIQWEFSTDTSTISFPLNITDSIYTYNNLTQTTYFRVRVKSGFCSEKISKFVTVNVDAPLRLVADTIITTLNKSCQSGVSVLINDFLGHFYKIVSVDSLTTSMGGRISLDSLGFYKYIPPSEFTGVDKFTYTVCDKATGTHCISSEIVIIVKDTVIVYSSLTPNDDGMNDVWIIDGINSFSDNTVKIINRWGDLVFVQEHYNNKEKVWRGESNAGIGASEKKLPDGTYFYSIDLNNGSKPITGFVVIKQ